MVTSTASPDVAGRLDALRCLGERLSAYRHRLVQAAGEGTGAPCTTAGIEVDLASEHLLTMAEEMPQVQDSAELVRG